MKILSIETSCDETAVSIVDANGGVDSPSFEVLGNALFSQIDIHKEYGGVYPMLAKREHAKNLPPLLTQTLKEAKMWTEAKNDYADKTWQEIEEILKREQGLFDGFRKTFENLEKPVIDFIAVTSGPGLEPALWVGISCALALGRLWNIPVVPTNHMEGHIASVLVKTEAGLMNQESRIKNQPIEFPAIALLISGGHTEIVQIDSWGKYKVLGQTVDDAVGEAFDKTARLMELPYPGGPEISKLAHKAREKGVPHIAKFPRPMLHSKNLNFSFAGLKTAVLYYIRDNFNGKGGSMTENEKEDLSREFEDAVVDVLLHKTKEALSELNAKTLIIGGGVIASKKIREVFLELERDYPGLMVKVPEKSLTTDNALMIAAASYINVILDPKMLESDHKIKASGNLRLQ